LNIFLHAGESKNLNNDNTIDSLILKTPRIGHGLNLHHNLSILEEVKKANICIETNPLSNNFLNYVHDLRLHPLKAWLNHGVKVSISCDDDGVFGTESIINFDFLIAGASMKFNLWDFKQVCYNSIVYSQMEENITKKLLEEWNKRWILYIAEVLNKF